MAEAFETNQKFLGASGVKAGMAGQAADWWMLNPDTLGFEFFVKAMGHYSAQFYKKMLSNPETGENNIFQRFDDPKTMGSKKAEFYAPDVPKEKRIPGTGFSSEEEAKADFEERTGKSYDEEFATPSLDQSESPFADAVYKSAFEKSKDNEED